MPYGPAGFLMKTNLLAPYIDVFRAPLVNGHLLSMHSLVLAIFLSVVKAPLNQHEMELRGALAQ